MQQVAVTWNLSPPGSAAGSKAKQKKAVTGSHYDF
jgi:hypothetical protein